MLYTVGWRVFSHLTIVASNKWTDILDVTLLCDSCKTCIAEMNIIKPWIVYDYGLEVQYDGCV